jgi:hypothetical protein
MVSFAEPGGLCVGYLAELTGQTGLDLVCFAVDDAYLETSILRSLEDFEPVEAKEGFGGILSGLEMRV